MDEHAEKINVLVPRVESTAEAATIALVTVTGQSCSMGRVKPLVTLRKPQRFYKEMRIRSGWELKKRSKESMCQFLSKKLKAGFWRDIFILMFIVAFFTIDKRWKWSKCPLETHEWINNTWYVPKNIIQP